MIVDFNTLSSPQIYQWMTQSVIPRPIAWILSVNADGSDDRYNLAPFSYFTAVASAPPTVLFSTGKKDGERFKDTFVNVSERRHCVINIATVSQSKAVTETSRTLSYGESELAGTGIAICEFDGFHLPRVVGSPIALACDFSQTIAVGSGPQMLVLCQISRMYVADEVMVKDEKGRDLIDAAKVDPLCRLGAAQYASLADIFSIPRPK